MTVKKRRARWARIIDLPLHRSVTGPIATTVTFTSVENCELLTEDFYATTYAKRNIRSFSTEVKFTV